MKHNLPKNERLSGLINIEKLFTEGNSFIVYPLRVVFRLSESKSEIPVQILAGVSKKRFKKASDRNKIKRHIKEAYRLNKETIVNFYSMKNKCVHIAFFYIADVLPEKNFMEEKMKITLTRIIEKTTEKTN
jgi:ribonuclease P protein component